MKSVVLLSGGMDSTAVLAQAIADGSDEIHCVSCRYGSKHQDSENLAAMQVVDHYRFNVGLKSLFHQVVSMPDVFRGAKSALMGEVEMPHLTYAEIATSVGPSPTVVPFRNANLISVAAAIASAQEASYVYIAAHGEDARNWAYPDCTPEFMGAMANAVYVGTYHQVQLRFPFIWMLKWEVCKRGMELDAPLHLTWSCYEGGLVQCGKCPTCIERKDAFERAGYADPTQYLA
jgi:7-cyano-7-deazaguanine synthase